MNGKQIGGIVWKTREEILEKYPMPTPAIYDRKIEEIADLERRLMITTQALEVVVAIARTNATGAINHCRNALRQIKEERA